MRFNARKLCALSVAAAAVGTLGVLPGTAAAGFDAAHDRSCETTAGVFGGDSITGIGASFQTQAQRRWGATLIAPAASAAINNGFGYDAFGANECDDFKLAADGGTETISYSPAGSGAGRGAFGANGRADSRHTNSGGTASITPVNYGGVDEAPTATQVSQANAGDTLTSNDDAVLHTIPVASSSVGVSVRIPDGCAVTGTSGARRITTTRLERAFAGDTSYDTWGEVLINDRGAVAITGNGTVGSQTGVACASIPFNRVVRFDSSGTTFSFKRYLHAINPTLSPTTWEALGNAAWPAGGRATINAGVAGANAQATLLASQTEFGGIGYLDLATARANEFGWGTSTNDANDRRFWLYVQRLDDSTIFRSPAVDNAQSATTTKGALCARVTYADRVTRALPSSTAASWYEVDAATTTADYPICALTYALAWEDPVPVNTDIATPADQITQARQLSTKDYLWYVLDTGGSVGSGTECGQGSLAGNDYQALPSAVLSLAQAGVRALDWNVRVGGRTSFTYETC